MFELDGKSGKENKFKKKWRSRTKPAGEVKAVELRKRQQNHYRQTFQAAHSRAPQRDSGKGLKRKTEPLGGDDWGKVRFFKDL